MRKELTLTKLALLLVIAPAAALAQQPATLPTSQPAAQKSPSKTVVLLESDGAIPSFGREIVTGGGQLGHSMQLAGLALEDLMVAVGCADRTPGCLKKIGDSIAATALLLVNARLVANKVEVLFHLFDVGASRSTSRSTVLLPLDPIERKPVLAKMLGSLYGVKVEQAQAAMGAVGTLFIAASQRFAQVSINGQARGALPLELRDMPVGTYSLVARLEGFHSWEGSVKVLPNRLTRVYIEMIPSLRDTPGRSFMESIRLPTWVAAGVGATSLVMGAIFGAHMVSQQHDFDSTPTETPQDIDRMRSLKDTGERDAIAANVLLGVGSAALVAAAVMAYIDYRLGQSQEPTTSDPAPSVVIGPGAVQVGLRF